MDGDPRRPHPFQQYTVGTDGADATEEVFPVDAGAPDRPGGDQADPTYSGARGWRPEGYRRSRDEMSDTGEALPPVRGGGAPPAVAAMLMSRRRPHATDCTLSLVLAQTMPVCLLLVVNVEADAETREVVDSWTARRPEVEYLPVADNVGPAGGVHLGIETLLRRRPDAEFIALFEDDDPPPEDGSLARLVGHLERHSPSRRVGGVGFHGARFSWRSAVLRRPALSEDGYADVDYLGGGAMPVFRRAMLVDVGTYDPTFFFGFEELEFGLRARAAGWRLHIIAGGSGRHPTQWHGGGRKALAEWNWRRYYSLRNLIVILLRRRRRLTALQVALGRGIVKPLLWLPWRPSSAVRHLRYNSLAIYDALAGRLGRTVPPGDIGVTDDEAARNWPA
jgi:GT2 family glycosyltransferase